MSSPVRIACFGDSLTEGYGLHRDEALPVVLEDMLRDEGIQATLLNFGVSGDTSEDGLERLDEVLASNPDGVIIEFGANDCFVGDSVDLVRANLVTIMQAFKERQLPMLMVGISAMTNMDESYAAAFNPLFKELSHEYDVPLFPDILTSYFGNSMLTLMDGMHPNDQGVRAIARDLLPQVIDLVDKASK